MAEKPPLTLEQLSNRNFLSIAGFQLVLEKCPKVDFLCNMANLPGVTLGIANQSTYLKNIPVPGDKLQYGDFTINFIVDENLENYNQIYGWMNSLGFPESISDFDPDEFSDGTLLILNSNYQIAGKVKFKDLFPYSLTGLPFDATIEEQKYFAAQVSFKYTIYNVIDIEGEKVSKVVS